MSSPVAALAGAGATALLLLAGGTASATPTRAAGALAPAPRLHVTLPTGWVSRPLAGGGLVAAQVPADLGAAAPTEATFTAVPAPAGALNVGALLAGVDKAPFVGVPTMYATKVAGRAALYVQWTAAEGSGDETSRTIVVGLPTGAYAFTLEAPASKWTPSFPAFDRILASVSFG